MHIALKALGDNRLMSFSDLVYVMLSKKPDIANMFVIKVPQISTRLGEISKRTSNECDYAVLLYSLRRL